MSAGPGTPGGGRLALLPLTFLVPPAWTEVPSELTPAVAAITDRPRTPPSPITFPKSSSLLSWENLIKSSLVMSPLSSRILLIPASFMSTCHVAERVREILINFQNVQVLY